MTKDSQSLNKTSFTKNNLETGGELSNFEERSNFEEKNFLEETNSLEERNNFKERSNLEENSNLKDTNNLDDTSSLDKVEETSNLEKAEDRRASMMQEILEEDLGDMKIRLIALERKVDKLHPGSSLQQKSKI